MAFSSKTVDGKEYSTSLGDYLYAWIIRKFGEPFPKIVIFILLAISALLLLRRIWVVVHFEFERRRDRKLALSLERRKLLFREIDIYSSKAYTGSPFTGGIFKPYICLPQSTFGKLTKDEQQAVLQHEIAHIKHWDLLLTLTIKFLGDFFWFIPGYRFLSRKIDGLREILADKVAAHLGAAKEQLASALLKLKELPEDSHHAALYSAFFREKSILKKRVHLLLGEQNEPSRFGWNYLVVKLFVVAWSTGAVVMATLGGNYELGPHELPTWVTPLLHRLGLM